MNSASETQRALKALTQPPRLYARDDLAGRGGPPPAEAGLYAWYFTGPMGEVPMDDCRSLGGRHLLYVGIAPSGSGSKATIRSRIRQHLGGNISGSTLRKSLACVLGPTLTLQPRRIGRTARIRLPAAEERRLSDWIAEHARISWALHPRPWEIEGKVIRSLSLPLNLDQNLNHPFYPVLRRLRAQASAEARRLPILPRA